MMTEFDEIYDRLAQPVYRYLRRSLGSHGKAEDLLQETFMKLHVQLAAGQELANTKAWLFRVAGNLVKDKIRSEIRERLRREPGLEATVVDFHARLQEAQKINRALGRLSPRMRQVLLLSTEGFTYREISEISLIEPAYVGVLLQRARLAFRKYYEERGGIENSVSEAE